MIETTKQAMAAIEEIYELTGWHDSEIARRAGFNRSTIHRIRTGKMKFPGYKTRKALTGMLIYARGLRPDNKMLQEV